jgi:hypothetical protein
MTKKGEDAMAFEQPLFAPAGMVANSDLSQKGYCLVKMVGDMLVDVCSVVTDKPIGIVQNAPSQGQMCEVMSVGVSKLQVGQSDLDYGASVGTDINGNGAPYVEGTDTTKYIIGQVISSGSAGAVASVAINCLIPHRGS